ncbi:MAG: hypothetical protein JSU72_14610, partial [Deltaproteobacteria bacterium]
GDEVLTMEPKEGESSTPAKRPSARRQRPRSGAQAGRTISLSREEIESSFDDLNQLMQQVRIRPYMEGKRPAGFLMSNIKPGSIFSKMGLRNGDVVKSVNNQTISTPEQAFEFYERIMEDETIDIEIKRGRRQQKLHYEIE